MKRFLLLINRLSDIIVDWNLSLFTQQLYSNIYITHAQ